MYPWFKRAAKAALQTCFTSRKFLWRLPRSNCMVGLTFDDGPHPVHTTQILDLLQRENCKATFFLIGKNVEKYPSLVRRIADEGHTLGVHGYEHREIVHLSAHALASELGNCQRAIYEASGITTTLFRPPRGRVSGRSILRVMKLGYCVVHWTKTYNDYRADGVGNLMKRLEENPMQVRDIILLHDDNQATVDMLLAMLPRYRQRGIEFQAILPLQ